MTWINQNVFTVVSQRFFLNYFLNKIMSLGETVLFFQTAMGSDELGMPCKKCIGCWLMNKKM